MTSDQVAVELFKLWWNAKPSANVCSPKLSGHVPEEVAIAIWLSAWRCNPEQFFERGSNG